MLAMDGRAFSHFPTIENLGDEESSLSLDIMRALWHVWEDSRAVSQPTPSLCLCANAVLKWAHYHQREHKHSSRKQDSLCQEREPLPEAYCRPDDITRLKIRQRGSYYYCRHAPQAPKAEENPPGCRNILFLSFCLDCSLSTSNRFKGLVPNTFPSPTVTVILLTCLHSSMNEFRRARV